MRAYESSSAGNYCVVVQVCSIFNRLLTFYIFPSSGNINFGGFLQLLGFCHIFGVVVNYVSAYRWIKALGFITGLVESLFGRGWTANVYEIFEKKG